MTDHDNKYLADILQAIQLIESFISDTKDYDSYLADFKTQSAVERQLGILVEAVKNYNKLNPTSTLQNSPQIKGFRNRLIHTYDSIDQSIVWAIKLPLLRPVGFGGQSFCQLPRLRQMGFGG